MDGRFGSEYDSHFDPVVYLNTYYTAEKLHADQYYRHHLEHWHQVFTSGDIKPDSRLLEVGSGPNISNVISASAVCTDIVLTDLAEVNRRQLEAWVKQEPSAHNWDAFFQYVANLEQTSAKQLEQRLRSSIKQVAACDVLLPRPISVPGNFDVIISSCCLENACRNSETFNQVVANVASLLNTGGHFYLVGDLNKNFYMVGQEKFFSVVLNEDIVKTAFQKAGLIVRSYEEHTTSGKFADANGYFMIAAQKN